MPFSCQQLFLAVLLVIGYFSAITVGLLPGLYCGERNCYDVIGVERGATKAEISKAYRRLAAKFHPDRFKGEAAKKQAENDFRAVATAYEILKDDDSRKDYDYLLDNPDEVYRHYFYYYRRRVKPNVDIRIVIAVTIAIISTFQYLSAWHKYSEAVTYLMSQPKYRLKAIEIAKERGLLDDFERKSRKGRSKEDIRLEEYSIIRSIIEENVDIKGGYQKPSLMDTLFVQILTLPYHACLYIWWFCTWIYRFRLKGEEYGLEEKYYLIRKNLGMSEKQFSCVEEAEKEEYLAEKLWIKGEFAKWKAAKDQTHRQKLAESAQYKRYRRYMKTRGQEQITFIE